MNIKDVPRTSAIFTPEFPPPCPVNVAPRIDPSWLTTIEFKGREYGLDGQKEATDDTTRHTHKCSSSFQNNHLPRGTDAD